MPDRLVILPDGKVGFAELKRHNGKPSKLQRMQMSFIKKLGCFVMIINSEKDIEVFISGINFWYDSRKKAKYEI